MIYSSVIIVGAPRSGTNMLRDVLTKLSGFATWPCDEINYIWRHGNLRHHSDEFTSDMATLTIQGYIRRKFDWVARHYDAHTVVEKTCANSLRIAFVERVVPDAKFIFIVRDGRDVVTSAMKRWVAPLDIPYLLKKAPYLPVTDAPYYVIRYFWNRIYRLFSNEKRVSFWGPHFEGMEEMLRSRSLAEVCAMQWVCCVEKSEYDLDQLDSARVHRLRYEDFVTNPSVKLKSLAEFLNIDFSEDDIRKLVQGVSTKSVGNWKNCFDQEALGSLEPLIISSMKRYGYF